MEMSDSEREFAEIRLDLQDEDPLTRAQAIWECSDFVKDHPKFKSAILTLLERLKADPDEDVRINAKNLIRFLEGRDSFCPSCGRQTDKKLLVCEFCGGELGSERKESRVGAGNEGVPEKLSLENQRAASKIMGEIASLREKVQIYRCLICICLILGTLCTYFKGGAIPAAVFLVILIPTIGFWIYSMQRLGRLAPICIYCGCKTSYRLDKNTFFCKPCNAFIGRVGIVKVKGDLQIIGSRD
jgi:hypothetical protein